MDNERSFKDYVKILLPRILRATFWGFIMGGELLIPMLIPGVGSQGGDLKMVLESIKDNPYIHRINSSSGIAYAYEKKGGKPTEAALRETKRLNEEIRNYL